MEISIATKLSDLDEVYRFRYSIYIDEMNRRQRYADHDARKIEDSLDCFGHVLVARDDGILVGTVRTNFLRDGDIGEYTELYGLSNLTDDEHSSTSITTRLMIAKAYRAGTLAVQLSKAAFEFALLYGISGDYIDCNPPLDSFFARLGYKPVRNIAHPEYGNVVVMKLDLNDHDSLRTIKSPFLSSIIKPKFFRGRLNNVHRK